jgi:hypothetical protein
MQLRLGTVGGLWAMLATAPSDSAPACHVPLDSCHILFRRTWSHCLHHFYGWKCRMELTGELLGGCRGVGRLVARRAQALGCFEQMSAPLVPMFSCVAFFVVCNMVPDDFRVFFLSLKGLIALGRVTSCLELARQQLRAVWGSACALQQGAKPPLAPSNWRRKYLPHVTRRANQALLEVYKGAESDARITSSTMRCVSFISRSRCPTGKRRPFRHTADPCEAG